LAAVLPHVHPIALKLSGGPESFEGKTALRLLACRADTLVFHYWVGTAPEWPYADGQNKIDLFLAKGPNETRHAAHDYALIPSRIVITGQGRFSPPTSTGAAPTQAESRRYLGLPTDGQRYIGFDPNGALRGYYSVREQTEMTVALLCIARRHPRFIVVVKPHPSYPIDHLTPLLAEAALANVYVMPRRSPVNHFLNAVELVVTKFSTLMLEAALADRVAVSALFDGEDRFKIYGDLPKIVRSPCELESLLDRLSDERFFEFWHNEQLERQKALLPGFYYQTDRPSVELAADAVVRCLPGRIAESVSGEAFVS
jgi:CDP-glycerol glycerophosphotransferase (TagB/SpsB family)